MPLNPNLHSTSPFFILSPELMASLTPEGQILEVNPAWETSLGFPAGKLIGTSFFDLLHPEDRPKAMVERTRLSRGKQEKVSFESRCADKAGVTHRIVWTLLAVPAQDHWILMGRDVTDLRQTERALAESREKFQKFSDSSTEGVALHDNGVILEANQALARMFGYEQASEMIGKNGLDLTDAPGREIIRRHIQAHSEQSYEAKGLRQDGSAFPCQIRSREILYQGRALRVTTFLDMTSLREREKEILESEEKFRRLAEAATEGVAITLQGKILEVNQALARLFGYEPEEMIGRSAMEFCSPESLPDLTRMVLSNQQDPYEGVGIRKDGSRIALQISGRAISFRGHTVRVSVFKDLTDQKKREAETHQQKAHSEELIRESEEKFRKIFEEAFFGMALVDLSPFRFRRVLKMNSAFHQMLGYREEELMGKTMTDFCHPEDLPAEGGSLGRILDGQSRREEMDKRYIRKDGVTVWAHIILIVIRDSAGKPLFGLVMAQDITQQREAEAARSRSEARLRAVFNSGSQTMVVLDRQGRLESFNTRAEEEMRRIRGLSLEVGRLMSDYLEGPLLEFFKDNFKKSLQGQTLLSERQVTGLQQDHWFEFQYHPVLNERGQTTAVCVTSVCIDDRKKAQDTLRQSEERFRRIFEDGSVGMTLVAPDKKFFHVNRAFCDLVGYTAEELQTMTFRDITHPDDLEQNIRLSEELPQGRGFQMQKRYRHKAGGVVWANITVTALHDERGQFLHSLGIVENITEQKRVEENIRESEERYRRLVEFSPDSIFVYTNEKIVYVNPAGLKLLGASDPGQVVGLPVLSLAHPEDRAVVARRIENATRNRGENPPLEQKFIRLDGQSVEVEAQGTSFAYQGKPAGLMIARDITQRKRAIQAFRESQESYRRLVEFFPETVLVHSEGKLLYINPPGLKMFGASEPGEILGRSVFDFVSTPFLETARIRVEGIYLNKLSTDPMDQVWLKLDGSPLDVEVRGTFFNFMGKPSILSILRNVSERKRTQQMLLRYERLAAVGQVIAGIAHDIRNPLAVLSSMTLHLKEKFEGSASVSKEVETITAQTNRLKRLMNDILDYAKGYTLVKQAIEPRAFLEQCLKLVQTQVGSNHPNVEVRWKMALSPASFVGDRERLEQVLLNLILNAYEALEKGGVLTLGFESTDQMVCLKVEDNGPGIPEGALPRLFEPFFTTKKYGSGLGLSLSQKIVEAHGGKIEAEWVYPHGTLFTVQIPKELS
jgi:two-component system sporulation sensor kinase A